MNTNYIKLSQIVQQINKYFISIDQVELLLDSGYEINYAVPVDSPLKNYHGYTLLHFAVDLKTHQNNRIAEITSLLLKRNADFTCKDKRNFTPLRLAFQAFVDLDIKIIHKYNNLKTDIYQLISAHLEYNNSTNLYSDDGISHMHIACIFQRLEVVKLFLESGVPVNEAISSDSRILPGFTCLHIAMANKHKEMVHLLLEHGADCNRLNAKQMSPLHLIDKKRLNEDLFEKVNVQLNERESQKNECILHLITHPRADEFSPLYNIGLTELHALCIQNHSATELDGLEKFLRNKHSDVNAAVNSDSPIWSGQTALHFATHCNLQMVLLLLKNGANLMAKCASDITPLDLCLENYEPSDIANILKTQKNFKSINFLNGASLVETLIAFSKTQKLGEHLKTFDSKTTIPFDSPLWPGFSFLHLAVILSQGRDKTKVNLCLAYDADITVQDANGMTALHLAFHKEKQSCIDAMLKFYYNPSINPVDCKNLSHFHVACISEDLKIIKQFLDAGLDPNIPIQDGFYKDFVVLPAGSTPLHIAVALRNKNLAKLLLRFEADPFILDADGFTWIHRAFLNGSCNFNNLFWNHPDALTTNPVAAGGLSHFHVACCRGSLKVVEALLLLTSDINEPITDELMKYLDKDHPELICSGQTSLHIALESSNKEIANFLFNSGADIEAKNSKGLSPLYIALSREECFFFKTIASKLVKNEKLSDEYDITLLHLACASGNDSWVKTCLERKDNVNKRISLDSPVWPGESPINIAWKIKTNAYRAFTFMSYTTPIELLLDHFVKNMEIPSGDQELHGLVKRRRTEVLRERLFVNSEGLTVFHVSCGTGNPDIVEQFIKLGVDINAPTDFLATSDAGFTPLHFAVKYGSSKVIKILLKHGANISSKNLNDYTPVQMAAANRSKILGIFLRLCNVNVKIKTTCGKTLLDLLIENPNQCSSDFKELLSRGAAENINFCTMKRLVNNLAYSFSEDFSSLLKYIPNLTDVDEDGRNVIHHVIEKESFSLDKVAAFVSMIESLVGQGCKLDHQDKRGETPLLCAARKNPEKFEALLLSGADLSITDIDGQTPCATFLKNLNYFSYYLYRKSSTLKLIRKIIALGLDPTLSSMMQYSGDKTSKLINKLCGYTYEECLDLNSMKQINITESFALRDVFTEKMVMEFPVMPSHQREAILRYLEVSDVMQENFSVWLPLYKMQILRARKREESFESTITSLRNVLDPRLPDHVLESILVCLRTQDWNNVARAVNGP